MLLYAQGGEHPLRDRCRDLLNKQANGQLTLATTIEVIQEFTHVYSRRRPRPTAVALALRFAEALDILTATAADLSLGLSLFERHERLGAFDAVLAAVALNHGAEALVSADRAFGLVEGLTWLNPMSLAFTDLVGY